VIDHVVKDMGILAHKMNTTLVMAYIKLLSPVVTGMGCPFFSRKSKLKDFIELPWKIYMSSIGGIIGFPFRGNILPSNLLWKGFQRPYTKNCHRRAYTWSW